MKLIYRGERRFDLAEDTNAAPLAGEVELEVIAAGICGSDIHGYAGLNDRRPPGTVMGHEVVGRVLAIGSNVDLEIGDVMAVWPIVACGACELCRTERPHLCQSRRLFGCTPELPGGFATRMTVPAENLVPLEPGVAEELGALVEPLAVGHHAVRLTRRCLGDRVGVVGGGPIGIATAIAARRQGAAEVTVVEPVAERRRTLVAMGFEAVTAGDSPRDLETVFECVGKRATVRAAVDSTAPGGTVVCIGVAEPELEIPMVALVIEERRLLGSSAYTREDFVAVARSLGAGDVDFDRMIEARTDLAGAPATFAAYAAGETAAIKTLVIPNPDDARTVVA